MKKKQKNNHPTRDLVMQHNFILYFYPAQAMSRHSLVDRALACDAENLISIPDKKKILNEKNLKNIIKKNFNLIKFQKNNFFFKF